jgi:phage host-nuclease inhibitor protein Gam
VGRRSGIGLGRRPYRSEEIAMNVLDLVKTAEEMQPAAENLPDEIAGYEDAENPEVRGGWAIENLPSADWALARLTECESESDEIDRQAKAAIQRIRTRADELKAKAAKGAGFFRHKLTEYAVRHRADLLGSGKRKSREFVHGKIAWRSKPERLVVDDPAALEAWLLAQPVEDGLYRMKVEPEMRVLQERLKSGGEVPPGCRIHLEPETITVTAAAPESALAKE